MSGTGARWGFCAGCERWRLSDRWGDSAAEPGPARCPVCGSAPDPLERLDGERARLELVLELPPGADLPLLG